MYNLLGEFQMVEKLKQLHDLGITMEAIGKGMGTTRSAVNNWLKGTKNMSEASEAKAEAYLENLRQQLNEIL